MAKNLSKPLDDTKSRGILFFSFFFLSWSMIVKNKKKICVFYFLSLLVSEFLCKIFM